MITSWRKELLSVLREMGEIWEDIEAIACDDLDREFDTGYGAAEGPPITVWTKNNVYFPACYDGSEWLTCVSRNPDGWATNHIGGG